MNKAVSEKTRQIKKLETKSRDIPVHNFQYIFIKVTLYKTRSFGCWRTEPWSFQSQHDCFSIPVALTMRQNGSHEYETQLRSPLQSSKP